MFYKNLKRRSAIHKVFLLFICVTYICNVAISQDKLNTITLPFYNYNQQILGEKIFVHTDKSFYVAGEIIWFKLYDVDGMLYKPLDLSKLAYVEILDASNKPVLQAKIALDKGDGNGSFYLPQSFNSGNYKLRAYTNWMKNFDVDDFFEKNITIVNTQKTVNESNADTTYTYDVQFFPEGGSMVNNIQSKIAFKGTDKYGKSVFFTGAITDNNDTLLKFAPTHAGMGNFLFTPLPGHSYKAIIYPVKGNAITKDLPAIYANGYVMNVTDANDDMLQVNLQSNITNPGDLFLLVHTAGSIKAALTGALKNGSTSFVVNKALLPDGISYITVFNSNKQPVCERLYFKRPTKQLQLTLSSDQPAYTKRNAANISIQTNTTTAANDSASLSVAVYRLDSLQSLDATFINSYLLLTSDIKGFVEDPTYYFTAPVVEAASAADNLMLTNGWRRFNWETIFSNTAPVLKFAPEYNGHIITGTVVNKATGNIEKGIETYLSAPGLKTQFRPSNSDNNGHIKYEVKDFYDTYGIVVQTDPLRDTIYKIIIDTPFSKQFSASTLPAFSLPAEAPNTLLDHSISMQVQNIYIANKLKQFLLPSIDTSSFYLDADASYKLDDFIRFTTLEEILREYIVLVNVTRKEGRVHLPTYDFSNKTMMSDDPLVLVDGIPFFDLNRFLNLDPLKLKSLEVVNRKYILGDNFYNGILNWKTYSGDPADYQLDPHAVTIDYEGLQMKREFYTPVYNTQNAVQNHLPDFRNVLYWSPSIKMATGSKQTINIYTSDMPGKYAVVVQGITLNGACGSSVLYFNVAE